MSAECNGETVSAQLNLALLHIRCAQAMVLSAAGQTEVVAVSGLAGLLAHVCAEVQRVSGASGAFHGAEEQEAAEAQRRAVAKEQHEECERQEAEYRRHEYERQEAEYRRQECERLENRRRRRQERLDRDATELSSRIDEYLEAGGRRRVEQCGQCGLWALRFDVDGKVCRRHASPGAVATNDRRRNEWLLRYDGWMPSGELLELAISATPEGGRP